VIFFAGKMTPKRLKLEKCASTSCRYEVGSCL